LLEAVELEKQDKLSEALACYRQGIGALLKEVQAETGMDDLVFIVV
jgi:hypothetical protein